MSLQELFQAMGMFKDGLNHLGASRAISSAQEEVEKINASEIDQIQKRAALTQLGNNLALNLAKTGAPVAQIQSAVGAVAPPQIKDANDANMQGLMTGDQGLGSLASKQQTFENEPRMLLQDRMDDREDKRLANSLRIAELKSKRTLETTDLKAVKDTTDKFNTHAKKYFEAVEQSKTAKGILDAGNPIGDQAVATFMARATGEVGNLTEAERLPFGTSMDVKSRFQQAAKQLKDGKLTDENRQFLSQLADVMGKRNKLAAKSVAERMSKQTARRIDKDPDVVMQQLWVDDDEGSTAPQRGPPQSFKLKNGSIVKGWRLPDGSIEQAD